MIIMKKRSNILTFGLVALMLFVFMPLLPGTVQEAYADEDSVAPELNGFKIVNYSVERPGVVQIQLDITEEESGFSDFDISLGWMRNGERRGGSASVGLEYGGMGGDMCTNFELQIDRNSNQFGEYSGTYTFNLYVGRNADISDYTVERIWIRDKYGNTNSYENESLSAMAVDGIGGFSIKGDSSEEDFIAPVLSNYTILTPSVSRTETVKIQLDVFEEGSGFSDFGLSLSWARNGEPRSGDASTGLTYGGLGGDMCANFELQIDRNSNQFGEHSGTYTFNLSVGNKVDISTYTITTLWIRDAAGNVTSYSADDLSVLASSGDNTFDITGDTVNDDIMAPVLNSCQIINPVVNRPGVMKFKINITEAGSGLSDIGLWVSWMKNGVRKSGSVYLGLVYGGAGDDMCSNFEFWSNNNMKNFGGKSGSYIFTLLLEEKADLTTYTIDSIWLRDKYDNAATYNLNEGNTFLLRDEFNYNFATGTNNPNLATKLSSMPVGSAAKVEITGNSVLSKACLDAIKGKDKTIVAYSKGVQWVIRGKQLTGATKDLNLGVSVSSMKSGDYFEDNVDGSWIISNDSVRLAFYPNGKLPGTMQVRFKSDALYDKGISGNSPLLYYYNGEQLVLENNGSDLNFDGTDKWCYINITHNSLFAVSNTKSLKLKKLTGIAEGKSAKVGGNTYKVTSKSAVTFTKAINKKTVIVPATVKIKGKYYSVTKIGKKAFSGKKIRTVTIGSNVGKIYAKAFQGSYVNKLIIKTKKLKKAASVKKIFQGNKVKKVTVKYGKVGKKYVKKSFTKKNTKAKKIVLKK